MNRLTEIIRAQAKKSRLIVFLYRLIRPNRVQNDIASIQGQVQKSIESHWLLAAKSGIKIFDDIKDAGFRCYSQFEEDGIILYLLSCIGKKTRTVVEICCGHGSECMAANLIINHGYKGYLFDGNQDAVNAAASFFKNQKDCYLVEPTIKTAWITRDNINDLLKNSGVSGEVDVLSLDMDGNDYYIWEEISEIQPRICVFETQNVVPSNLAVTIPYKEDYVMGEGGFDRQFRSVSLLAMIKLSKKKGYTLVGSHKHGFNVFFVRNDLLTDLLPTPSIDEIDKCEWTRLRRKTRWPQVKNHPWVKV